MAKDFTKSLFGGDDRAAEAAGQEVLVALDTGADAVFSYVLPDAMGSVAVGQRVEVPFGRGNKKKVGFVIGLPKHDDADEATADDGRAFKLKAVTKIVDDEPLLSEKLVRLAKWISDYYVCPMGQVLGAMVPAAVKKGVGVKKKSFLYLGECYKDKKLTSGKQKAIVAVLEDLLATNPEHAIEKSEVLEEAESSPGPLRRLIAEGIVMQESREVLPGLPDVPEEFLEASGADIVLNDEQAAALAKIGESMEQDDFGVTLLYGVTDSGKTEVYIRAIQKAVERGEQAIVLLPEIALTTQTVNRFKQRFEWVAVMHSGLSAMERNAQWQRIKHGQADVVLGARSAVFAPVRKLGLIVVDEEHEGSYKQDSVPRYHGRDVAVVRAKLEGAHVILGSATPALETLENCRTKEHFQLVEMRKRVNDLPMPKMRLVDMTMVRGADEDDGVTLISPDLEDKLRAVLSRGEQAILLLNRRGYSNFVYCPKCRHTLHCKNCDVTLTFHKRRSGSKAVSFGGRMGHGYAVCHYCMSKTLVPEKCPLCSKRMVMIGLGSQRLEEELSRKVPDARVKRVDSDVMAGAKAEEYYEMLKDFAQGRIDVLAGTQILAKGLHFPNVTLVGVISADTALAIPDFRSNERTFQMLSQVAGRAGRSEKKGEVIVQTYLPETEAIERAMEHDYKGFVEHELGVRAKCELPPYGRMANVLMRDEKFERLSKACGEMRARIDYLAGQLGLDMLVRGPMECGIARMHGQHRMQIVVQAKDATVIGRLFKNLRAMGPIRPAVTAVVDVDPVSLL
ncbi:Primosomal protein N' [Anaerohalosphaera lusitana]|uniref:Replication restart protein PriA n=1 Tax=Anaerohalosphaera lusitana TaxID=1936003 RepID=A0A1U9NIH0_9BACT|nr:primosomal protein N' [Anaerohalosphaera lusitana]AQT67723.1 Primosomal protein N' [Anaerohalosphaera lusitana]